MGQQEVPATGIGKSGRVVSVVARVVDDETIGAQAERIRRQTVDDHERDVIQPQRQPGQLSARKIMQSLANGRCGKSIRVPLQIMEAVCFA